jgi:Animal haem peroxidase
MKLQGTPEGRVLTDLRHGGHAIAPTKVPDNGATPEPVDGFDGATTVDQAVATAMEDDSITVLKHPPFQPITDTAFFEGTTRFDYVFSDLTEDDRYDGSHLPRQEPSDVVRALDKLGDAMVEQDQPAQGLDSPIPAVYTYWGQFIDHDLTANTDRDSALSDITRPKVKPLLPDRVRMNLRNLRQPALNLDSVYGDGPTFSGRHRTAAADFYIGPKFVVGEVATTGSRPIDGVFIPPEGDLLRDLPRMTRKAQIGDGRNDENLIIAQFHTAFLRFHNAAVDWVREHERGEDTDARVFARARQLAEWHYQWLVVHDYLKTVTLRGVVDDVLAHPDPRFAPRDGEVFMPLEFSVAAFRFGHSMVRQAYDYNRNFGRPGLSLLPFAPFSLLFAFTGNGTLPPDSRPTLGDSNDRLPFNWIIEWERFVDKGSTFADRFARRIDTLLVPPLTDLSNEGNTVDDERIRTLLKNLARRNLLRGYVLSIPTGQAVADAMGVAQLSRSELAARGSAVDAALDAGGFFEKTPLWYYVLREAEVRAGGKTLGELGSRIVCQTIISQVRHDPTSYLRQEQPWTPDKGVKLQDGSTVTSISDFLRFAGVMS